MELFTYSFGVNSILKLQLTEEHEHAVVAHDRHRLRRERDRREWG